MSEYTPGPYGWDYAPAVYVETDDGDTLTLANVDPDNDPPLEEAIANAILFHTAPKLLEVCKALYSIVLNGMTEDYDYMTACLGKARAVIAQATQEAPDADTG